MKTKMIEGRICTRKHRVTKARACYQGLKGTPRAYAKRAVNAADQRDRQTCRDWLIKLATYVAKTGCARTQVFAGCVVNELTC